MKVFFWLFCTMLLLVQGFVSCNGGKILDDRTASGWERKCNFLEYKKVNIPEQPRLIQCKLQVDNPVRKMVGGYIVITKKAKEERPPNLPNPVRKMVGGYIVITKKAKEERPPNLPALTNFEGLRCLI
ncbi:hypothetical protein QE152_g29319 [Popillia japonica]|uniref:Uncharacterized protein n=1 Tax=Popillia japonica TaxID=7064 RepID=A0AAW1JI01_POPJA